MFSHSLDPEPSFATGGLTARYRTDSLGLPLLFCIVRQFKVGHGY